MTRWRPWSRERVGLPEERVATALATGSQARVAVLAGDDASTLLGRLRALAPAAQVTVLRLPLSPSELSGRLVGEAPYDVLIDVAGGPDLPRRFAAVSWSVRGGGTVVVGLPESDGRRFFERLQTGEVGPAAGLRPRHQRALLRGLEGVSVGGDWVVATRTTEALAKLGEDTVARFLADRPRAGRTLTTVPGETWTVGSPVTTSRPLPRNPLPTSFAAPPAALREYDQVVVMPGRASWLEGAVLPESFRHQLRPELRNRELQELAPEVVERPPEPQQRLDGVWFNLTSPLPHHFGHALTEQLGHAWGWAEARQRYPDIRVLVATMEHRPLTSWELEILEAAGVPAELVTEVTEPVRVERLLDTTAMYETGGFVHPGLRRVYDDVGATLAARATTTDLPARLFHTRRSDKRRCRNRDDVEAMFVDAGFTVVAPEDSPLPDQVARIRAAEVVAGFAGSSMFHIALTGGPRHVIVMTHEGYPAHNEYQLSALLGHRLDLSVSVPDVPRTSTGYQRSAFHSDFVVDPETEGAYLRSLLD